MAKKKPKVDESELIAEAFSDIMSQDKSPKKKPDYKLKKSVKVTLILILTMVFIGVGTIIFLSIERRSDFAKAAARYKSNASFTLHEPLPLPQGYTLDQNSVRFEGGILFTTLANGDKKIFITQQKAPENMPGLSGLRSFNPVNAPLGTVYIGTDQELQTAVLTTGDTLISTSAEGGVGTEELKAVFQNLREVK